MAKKFLIFAHRIVTKKLAKMVLIFAHRIVTKKLAKILWLEPPSVIPGCLKGDDEGSLEDCDKERPKTNI